jgi:YidC/Oxa1 family membrane protein insertase
MDPQQKNLFIAIALTVLIMVGYQVFVMPLFEKPKPPAPVQQQTQTAPVAPAPATSPTGTPGATPNAPSVAAPATAPSTAAAKPKSRAEALEESPRVRIDTPKLHGSIALVGGRLDDLRLDAYHETADPKSPEIVLLSPLSANDGYSIDIGWFAADESAHTPGHDTRWTVADDHALTPTHPVELSWDNGQGLTFTRRIAVDENYLFTVTQKVENHGQTAVALFPYGSIARDWRPPESISYLLHEGPIGILDGKLHDGGVCFLGAINCDKYNYADVKKGPVAFKTTGGWLGFTDKYWLTALVPDQAVELNTKVRQIGTQENDRYQVEYSADRPTEIPAGATATSTSRIFAGAKEVKLLDRYEQEDGIPRFDRAIDFGWFYWITKPIFLFLDYLYGLIGNFGLAIMTLTLTVKLIFFPLANRSYRAMSKMKLLQPEIQKLRDKYGEDKANLNQEVMALYKRVGANPMEGCLPIFVQIPVFFSLYKVLYVTIEMRQAPFYGWIHDLSVPDPTTWVNLFGLVPWDPSLIFTLPVIGGLLHFASIGAWPLVMGVTMFLQQKLNPAPADPVQAKMMMALPIVFTFMLGQFAAGLVIYWSWNNLLTIAQQWVIMHRAGAA